MHEQDTLISTIGQFTAREGEWLLQHLRWCTFQPGEKIFTSGGEPDALYYLRTGACYQSMQDESGERVIDLHLEGEWMFVQESLVQQKPSPFSIQAFQSSRVAILGLKQIHTLIGMSPAFLQIGKLFNQGQSRLRMYDTMMDPAEKYAQLMRTRPALVSEFPIKMIASYLKLAPETLSRVRGKYRIS
jgi:CRP-like cAMP-binding protein